MPTIIFDSTPLPVEKKREIVETVVPKISEITGIGIQAITMIFHENSPESIAPGGALLSDRMKGAAK